MFKKVVLDSLNGVLTTLAFFNCNSPNPFFSGFESDKILFSFNKNSSKCTSRYVECSFDSQDDFFNESPEKVCSALEDLTQMEFFSPKKISKNFPGQVKQFFNKWLKLVDQNSEKKSPFSKKTLDYNSSTKKYSKCTSGHA